MAPHAPGLRPGAVAPISTPYPGARRPSLFIPAWAGNTVEKHGWSYKGDRDWRTRVIYETNLRTSYAAGRYEQMKEIASRRPYWRYRHSHASETPRLNHQAWDGLVLRHDDPWWDTHYPPNGWGCKCSVESLSQRDLERLGKDSPDEAPGDGMREVVVGRGTRAERRVSVPKGIDPGFAYAPGKAASLGTAVRNATRAAIAQEPGIAARGVAAILDHPGAMAAHADAFAKWRQGRADGAEAFRLGVVPAAVQDRLRDRHGIKLDTAVVTVTRRELAHTGRPVKAGRGAALDDADLDRLPEIVARPEDVLLDTGAREPTLLFVFTPGAGAGRKGKIVVRVNYAEFLKIGGAERGMKHFGNAVRTAGYVQPGNLLESRYESLREGE